MEFSIANALGFDPNGTIIAAGQNIATAEAVVSRFIVSGTLDARTREALIDVDQIDGVLDLDAFEHERREEAKDARHLEATRRAAIER